jgi:hypothetical protein
MATGHPFFDATLTNLRTDLLRALSRRGVYLTADYWLSQAVYQAFLSAQEAEYKTLDASNQE